MLDQDLRRRCAPVCRLAIVGLLAASSGHAGTIWTNWTTATLGANGGGAAAGSVNSINVSYSGELDGAVVNGTSSIWAPNSSFIGGTSTTSPSTVGDDLRTNGSFTGINTIAFSSPVQNPVFAIWSLGSPALQASFNFNATPTLQVGGPNSQFGGSAITVSGNVVNGVEGNGVVEFTGTFSSISWSNSFENFYAFTVGVNGPAGDVPEPGTIGLVGLGCAGLLLRLRNRT